MAKKLIAFDLDNTLAPSKSFFDPSMVELFNQLLGRYEVCVISGHKQDTFEELFLKQITQDPELLEHLHLLPTIGLSYYRFESDKWKVQYTADFTTDEQAAIFAALDTSFRESGYRNKKEIYGDTIEDRGGRITLSVLGVDVVSELGEEGVRRKETWDPDRKKRTDIQQHTQKLLQESLPGLECDVTVSGHTSVDVVPAGTDKASGMRGFMKATGFKKEDILFMGDSIFPGGNDYAVKEMGIDHIAVRDWKDTMFAIKGILGVTARRQLNNQD